MPIAKPDLMTVPFASAGLKNDIPISPPGGADVNQASYDAGFPPATMTPIASGGKPPEGRDMNGILYDITTHTVFQNAGGQYTFDADFAAQIGGYPKNAVLQSNDGKSSYVSLIDDNTTDFNDNPSSIGTAWAPWAGEAVKGATQYFTNAAGTSEVITAAFDPPLLSLTDGVTVCIRAVAANTSTNPSFNPNSLGALTIVKGANLPLAAGDIGGAGYLALLQYSQTLNKWILQNPAHGIDLSEYATKTEVNAGLATKADTSYVNNALARYLPLAGGTMTGNITTSSFGLRYGIGEYQCITFLNNEADQDFEHVPVLFAGYDTSNYARYSFTRRGEIVSEVTFDGQYLGRRRIPSITEKGGTVNWWRKWSDGWLEQGGYFSASDALQSIVFQLPYQNGDYTITIGTIRSSVNTSNVVIQDKLQSYFNVLATDGSAGNWFAAGWGA